jgi:hypothetical protein
VREDFVDPLEVHGAGLDEALGRLEPIRSRCDGIERFSLELSGKAKR